MDDHGVVEDEFKGVKVKWSSSFANQSRGNNNVSEERRYLIFSFHVKHREIIVESYLEHVLRKGREIEFRFYLSTKSIAIPHTLARNCGVNVIRTMAALQGKHVNGENAWTGIDGNTSAIANMKESKVREALLQKKKGE